MQKSKPYASFNVPLHEVLHGAARLHVALARMDQDNISTRGWTYNDLVSGVLSWADQRQALAFTQNAALLTVFDTLDAITEIGPSAVAYLQSMTAPRRKETTCK